MVHSAVSGLATGVAKDMIPVMMLAIACIAHDWSHACALVVMYVELGITKFASGWLLAMFVVTEPICIGVGIAATAALNSSASAIVSGVLSALAGGVFIFISVCELIREAFEEPHHHVIKLFLFFFFLSVIAAVAAIA